MRPRRDPTHPRHWLQRARRVLARAASLPRQRRRFQAEFVRCVREAQRTKAERGL